MLEMKRTLVALSCSALLVPTLGCDPDDADSTGSDTDTTEQGTGGDGNGGHDGHDGDDGDDGDDGSGEADPLPYEGIYSVTSHQVEDEGCAGASLEPASDAKSYFELEPMAAGWLEGQHQLDPEDYHGYFLRVCDAPGDCGLQQIQIMIPYDQTVNNVIEPMGQGSSLIDDICHLWRYNGVFEDTGDGVRIAVHRMEYTFPTMNSDDCTFDHEHWNDDEKECISQDIYDGTLVAD
jgi:hypothetical protein